MINTIPVSTVMPGRSGTTTMTIEQQKFMDTLEMALMHLVHNKQERLAKALGLIYDLLERDEAAIAVLEGEAMELDQGLLDRIRELFDVRY